MLLALQRFLLASQGFPLLAHRVALLSQGFPLLLDTGLLVAAPTGHLGGRGLPMLGGDLAGSLAVEIEARAAARHRVEVGGGTGMAPQEGRQHLPREHAGGALLNVGLDTQLQRPCPRAEQGREVLPEQVTAGSHRQSGRLG